MDRPGENLLPTDDDILSWLRQQVLAFLKEAEGRRAYRDYLENEQIRLYLRKSRRIIGEKVRFCLDIASIEIAEEYQGRGLFTKIMALLHEMNPYEVSYLESILNPVLEEWCKKRRWVQMPYTQPPAFYLLMTCKNV